MKDFADQCIINYTFKQMLEFTQPIQVNNLQQIRKGSHQYNIEDLRNALAIHISTLSTARKFKNKVETVDVLIKKLTYKVFLYAIKEFNECIIDEIIKGYTFHMGYSLSCITVMHKRRLIAPVDWGKSNKCKAEIIKDGRTPYDKEHAPDGDKWLVRHDTTHANYYRWIKKNAKLSNVPFYKFKPNSSNRNIRGAIHRLHEYNNKNPLNYLNYQLIDTHGKVPPSV